MNDKVELLMPPHADVRVIVEDLHKMREWMRKGGLHAPALDAATDMLTRQSIEIAKLRGEA